MMGYPEPLSVDRLAAAPKEKSAAVLIFLTNA
jgi:hypothetical protein